MNQDIHIHLEKLKTELDKLEPAVKHLQAADENANSLINALNNIHKEFSNHLQNIEKIISDSNNQHQKQITKDIYDSTKNIIDATGEFKNSSISFEKQIMSLLGENQHLSTETNRLITHIDKIDFPTRIDKLDATISSINQGLQNTQQRIGDLERNLKDDIQAKSKEIATKTEAFENFLKQLITDLERNLKDEIQTKIKEVITKTEDSEISLKQLIENSKNQMIIQFEKKTKENNLLKILLLALIGLSLVIIILQFIKGG